MAGLVLASSPFGTMVASGLAGRLIDRWSARGAAIAAALMTAAGLAGIGFWPENPPVLAMIAPLFLAGAGMGLFQVASMDVVTGSMPVAMPDAVSRCRRKVPV